MKVNKITLMIMATVISIIVFVTSVNASTTINVPGDQPTIGAAILAASPGDTINIAEGMYYEADIVVDKQLIIQGAGSGATIIDATIGATDYGILLEVGGSSAASADRQTIRGLTIKNSSYHGIKAFKGGGLNLNYVTIEDVVLTLNGSRGMEIYNDVIVSDMEITNCEFVINGAQGLWTASNVIVDGLVMTDSSFNDNSFGIYIQGTISNVTVLRSTFNDNNLSHGAFLTGTGPLTGLIIEDSEFKNNRGAGLEVWNMQDNADITITGSSFQDNGRWGVLIWGNTLTNVLIECSSVLNNDGIGINSYGIDFFTYDGVMTNVAVHNTNISGHTASGGIKNRNIVATAIVDGTGNWWGDASGPFHSTLNPGGLGDAVFEDPINNVHFDPWLSKLANCEIQKQQINIDIKPKHCPNRLKLNDDVDSSSDVEKADLKVAILGTQDFQVSTVDIGTIMLNGVTPVKSEFKDVTAPAFKIEPCDCEKLDEDTYKDLVLKFNKQDIIATLGAVNDGEQKILTLTGNLLEEFGGTAIEGKDCVLIVDNYKDDNGIRLGNDKENNHKDDNGIHLGNDKEDNHEDKGKHKSEGKKK